MTMERRPTSIELLPPEILSEIFLITQNVWIDPPSYINGRPPFLPFLLLCRLASVSSTWRSIINNLPFLWSTIRYRRPPSTEFGSQIQPGVDPQFPKVIQIFNLYFRRSQSLLLDMDIGAADLPPSPERTSLETLLAPHIGRVRSLRLNLVGTGENAILLPLPPTTHLKALTLYSRSDHPDRERMAISSDPSTGPPLRTLSISTLSHPIAYDSIPITHLEEISLPVPRYPELPFGYQNFLSRCLSLKHLTLHQRHTVSETPPSSTQPVVLPVISLNISTGAVPILVHQIQTPKLTSLVITGGRGPDMRFPLVQLPTWPLLSIVTLHRCIFQNAGFSNPLVVNPSITGIIIRRSSTSSYLRSLILLLGLEGVDSQTSMMRCSRGEILEPPTGWICPNLENLRLEHTNTDTMPEEFGVYMKALLKTRPKLKIATP